MTQAAIATTPPPSSRVPSSSSMPNPSHQSGHSSPSAGAQWSGMETPGMLEAKCSLLLAKDAAFWPKLKPLERQQVLVYQDKAHNPDKGLFGGENFSVEFPGATILQLEPSRHDPSTMPVTLTVGGKCYFSKENHQDFTIMMRTKSQSREMNLPPNGNFDWPDVKGMMLCPLCANIADPQEHRNAHDAVAVAVDDYDDDDEEEHDEHKQGEAQMLKDRQKKQYLTQYWMVFYPLLQITMGSNMTLGTRTMCRLTCEDCFEHLVEGMSVRVTGKGSPRSTATATSKTPNADSPKYNNSKTTPVLSFNLPAIEVLEEAGTVSFLGGDCLLPRPDMYPHPDTILDAWTLYSIWEQSGAWEALQNDYRSVLSRSMNGLVMEAGGKWQNNPHSVHRQPMLELKMAEKYGRPCDNTKCENVHGRRNNETGERIRLSYTCKHCASVHYCSKACQDEMHHVHIKEECSHRQQKMTEARPKQHNTTPRQSSSGSGNKRSTSAQRRRQVECETCKRFFSTSTIKKCSRCRSVNYCSAECQKKDWIRHKPICILRR